MDVSSRSSLNPSEIHLKQGSSPFALLCWSLLLDWAVVDLAVAFGSRCSYTVLPAVRRLLFLLPASRAGYSRRCFLNVPTVAIWLASRK